MTELAAEPDLIEECFRYLVMGCIQGITEFLPISSTAHLKVIPMLLGWDDPGVSITAVIQLGSILAVITYFRNDLHKVLKGIATAFRYGQWKEPNARLGMALCAGTIPIILTGMNIKFFWPGFEDSALRSIPAISMISIFMAILLATAERNGRHVKSLKEISGRDGLIIGIGQILALIPGVSRSGITLTAALFDDWQRQDAARFSFLIGIPAISIAGLAELKNALNMQITVGVLPLIIGIFSAATVSWLTIDWLLQYLQRHSTLKFVAYRFAFGGGLLIWWWSMQSN